MSHRAALMIDAYTLRKHAQVISQGGLQPSIDYGAVRRMFEDRSVEESGQQLMRTMYYARIINDNEDDQSIPVVRLLDWLSYNGFIVKTITVRRAVDAPGWPSVMIAVDALTLAARIDTLYLIASSDDLVPAVSAMQRAGVRVMLACAQQLCGDALRRQVDAVVDLTQIMQQCAAPQKART